MKNKLLFTAVALLGLITATMAQVPNYVPTNGLVGWWPFNGNANDESGNGNNGTVTGATLTTDRFGDENSAYSFNGSNAFINVTNSSSLQFDNQISISVWVNAFSLPAVSYILSKGSDGVTPYSWTFPLYSSGVGGFGAWDDGDGSPLGTSCGAGNITPVTTNQWTNIIITLNGTTGNLYLNGVLDNSSACSHTIFSNIYDLKFGRMGHPTGNWPYYLDGKLDDIGIWNRALTQQEITNLYNASLPPAACLPDYVPTDGLVGYWPFCGNANDESGNGNNGTVNGATLTTDRFNSSNSAFIFNGNQSSISFGSLFVFNQSTDASISIWINRNTFINQQGTYLYSTLSNIDSNRFNFYFNDFNNRIVLDYRNPVTLRQLNISNNFAYNSWQHVVYTRIDNTYNLFINGQYINSVTDVNPNLPTAVGWTLGADPATLFDFVGSLDDIAIYNRALTPQEIQQLYTGNTVNPDEFTLYMDTIPGINGQEVLMPIRVKNFNNMLSAQFTLQFDPSVISYAGFQNPGIPSITGGSFGQAQINNGVLTFAWSQPNVTPVSLEDDELLVNLRFNVIGAGGSFSPITFINSPTPIEFVDESFVPLNAYQTLPGRVDVLNIASLSGNLKTETSQPVRSATVAATGFATESTQSNLAGEYSLLLPQGQSYSITPSKGNDTLVTNGITTLDVLLIQRHILGILPLNSPYKIIAADVNQSGTVTSADINLINALILANISSYPSGQFWAFVPDNHVFSNPQNPFPFPAARTYDSLNTAVNQDFFGMKLGDVNNSYNPALARLSRSENAVELYIENQDVTEEATIQVPVKVKNFSDIAGFQFAVQWDAQVLRYIEINPANGGLDVNKGETMTEAGKLNINWTEPDASAISLDDESILLNITFEVVGGLGSNTDVEIYSSMTTPVEISTAELEVAEHSLQEGIVAVTTPSSVLEIEAAGLSITAFPNPFKDLTTLSVESSVQRMAILEVYDISGRLISSERITLQQGNTQHQLNVSKASGNYLIVLSDASKGNRLATLKLVKE